MKTLELTDMQARAILNMLDRDDEVIKVDLKDDAHECDRIIQLDFNEAIRAKITSK